MRWIIIKLVNLFIVLIVVTFLVAAIFTGPLAERQKNQITQDVRNEMRARFRNVPYTVVYQDCISRVDLSGFNSSVDNATVELSKNITDQQEKEIIKIVGEAYKLVIANALKTAGNIQFNNERLITEVTNKAIQLLTERGYPANEATVKKIVSSMSNELLKECRSKVEQSEIQIRIHQKGLDKPWFILSLRYTKMLLTFQPLKASTLTTQYWPDQGDQNTLHIIIERIPFSLALFTTSSILTLLVAMPLALVAARRPGGLLDNVITGWSVFSVSMPWWWLAMVFIYFFNVKYQIFPSPLQIKPNWGAVFQLGDLFKGGEAAREVLTGLKQIILAASLPVFTVTVLSIGDTAYRIRNILLDVFNEDFVTVARAKGVPEHMVLRKHVLRPAAPPLITIVVFAIVLSVFAGAIITELIFNWYGLGRLYWDAIEANDVPVILELTYITTLLYLIIRFILDILYTLLDPRIRKA